MSLNETPGSERIHISFFGRRNAGKSSVMNAVTGQNLAVVSEIEGTTTDPVSKAMELLPLGPVVMTDTAGIDDSGELGALRVQKTIQILNKTDAAVLVVDAIRELAEEDLELIRQFQRREIPYLIAVNKIDLREGGLPGSVPKSGSELSRMEQLSKAGVCEAQLQEVSAVTRAGIQQLKEKIGQLIRPEENKRRIVADLLTPGDLVVLVVPIDSSAPKGRLILPQQQTIRDILECGCIPVVARDSELKTALAGLARTPKLVITDSQAFGRVSRETPEEILLTSFSILFARYKGLLDRAVQSVTALACIEDGDRILICEGCTHHRQCGDIGTVKLPALIRKFTGREPEFSFTSGTEFPDTLSGYRLVIHCGGCMLNEREMRYRLSVAEEQQVPMTNYGIAIAFMNGILERSLAPFPSIKKLLSCQSIQSRL